MKNQRLAEALKEMSKARVSARLAYYSARGSAYWSAWTASESARESASGSAYWAARSASGSAYINKEKVLEILKDKLNEKQKTG